MSSRVVNKKSTDNDNLDDEEDMDHEMSDANSSRERKGEMPRGLDDGGTLDDRQLRILTKDNKVLTMSMRDLRFTKLVTTAVEADPNATETELPLMVTFRMMDKVRTYLEHHAGKIPRAIDSPLRSRILKEVVEDKWDAIFMDEIWTNSKQDLYDLILVANYLDNDPLLHLGCAKVASLIKGRSLEEIKVVLTPDAAPLKSQSENNDSFAKSPQSQSKSSSPSRRKPTSHDTENKDSKRVVSSKNDSKR